jgi:hypothetical protein
MHIFAADGLQIRLNGTIADKADVIINGYAFTREEDGIHVLRSSGKSV